MKKVLFMCGLAGLLAMSCARSNDEEWIRLPPEDNSPAGSVRLDAYKMEVRGSYEGAEGVQELGLDCEGLRPTLRRDVRFSLQQCVRAGRRDEIRVGEDLGEGVAPAGEEALFLHTGRFARSCRPDWDCALDIRCEAEGGVLLFGVLDVSPE